MRIGKNQVIQSIIILFSTFVSTALFADCELAGTVIQDTSCGTLIRTLDGSEVYEVLTSDIALEQDQMVLFSFVESTTAPSCEGSKAVDLTCVQIIREEVVCNFQAGLVINDNVVTASLTRVVDDGNTPSEAENISWTLFSTGESLGNASSINFTPQNFGIDLVCVSYEVNYLDGESCSTTICIPLHYLSGEGCTASFNFWYLTNTLVVVENTSENYSTAQWDVGGEVTFANDLYLSFNVPEGETIPIKLTVWDDEGCSTFVTQNVYRNSPDELCNSTACVWPGDTNGDLLPNIYDLFNIGLGFGEQGPVRELPDGISSSTQWASHFGEDWDVEAANVDLKHADCDGDGLVNEDDIDAIVQNYIPDLEFESDPTPGAPLIRLYVDQNSFELDENSPEQIEFSVDVVLGTPSNPMIDIHGIALVVEYPVEYIATHSVTVNYNDNSFFGNINDVLTTQKDLSFLGLGRYDLAYSRKNGESASGYGDVITINFIVISDIIFGRSEPSIDVRIDASQIKLIDGNGNLLDYDIDQGASSATVSFIDNTLTSTDNTELNDQIAIYPNPVQTDLNIDLNNLRGERLEVWNPTGQIVINQAINNQLPTVNVSKLESGVYWIKVFTKEGIATKRILVK